MPRKAKAKSNSNNITIKMKTTKSNMQSSMEKDYKLGGKLTN